LSRTSSARSRRRGPSSKPVSARVVAGDPLLAVRAAGRDSRRPIEPRTACGTSGGVGDRRGARPSRSRPATCRPGSPPSSLSRTPGGDLGGQPGLARAAWPDQRDEPVTLQGLLRSRVHLVVGGPRSWSAAPRRFVRGPGGLGRRGPRPRRAAPPCAPPAAAGRGSMPSSSASPGTRSASYAGERVRLPARPRPSARHQQPGELLVQRGAARRATSSSPHAGGAPAAVDLAGEEGEPVASSRSSSSRRRERLGESRPRPRAPARANRREGLGYRPVGDEAARKRRRVHVAGPDGQPVPRPPTAPRPPPRQAARAGPGETSVCSAFATSGGRRVSPRPPRASAPVLTGWPPASAKRAIRPTEPPRPPRPITAPSSSWTSRGPSIATRTASIVPVPPPRA